MRRVLSIIIAVLIAAAIPYQYALGEEAPLVENGDFSELDGEGFPVGWYADMWQIDEGASYLGVQEDGMGGWCAMVRNSEENDARFAQVITVEPNTNYRFSCKVKAQDVGADNIGANISIGNTFCYSESAYDTGDEWVELEMYGITASNQTSVTLFLRLGGYSSTNTGTAWFDDVSLEKVENLPEGAVVYDLTEMSGGGNNLAEQDSGGEPSRYTEELLLLTAIYAIIVLAVVRKSGRLKIGSPAVFATILAASAILHMAIMFMVRGYIVDINCFASWSEKIFNDGPTGFYSEDYFCDYPPGYMLMLWPVSLVRRLFGIAVLSDAHVFLLKLPALACDIIGAWIIYRFAKKRADERTACLLGAFYAFNPAVLVNSAAWGQIDSVLSLFIVLCALDAMDKKYVRSLIWFGAAMLIKPQAMLFAPLGLAAIIVGIVRSDDRRRALKNAGIGVASAVGIMYAAALLFQGFRGATGFLDFLWRPVVWLVELYGSSVSGYSSITINACNLYQIFGLNWVETSAVPLATGIAWALLVLAYAWAIVTCAVSKRREALVLTGGALIYLIFCFGPMIHERYMFPAIILMCLGYACVRDRRIIVSLVAMTAAFFLNQVLVLQGGMVESSSGHLNRGEAWLNVAISLINCINALYTAWVVSDICIRNHVIKIRIPMVDSSPARRSLFDTSDWRLNLRRSEYLAMAVVTLLYGIAAFTNLGDMDAPESGWTSSAPGDSVTFDLGETSSYHLTYYGGVCDVNFTVELSNDGVNWTTPYYAEYKQGNVFQWIWYAPLDGESNRVFQSGSGFGGLEDGELPDLSADEPEETETGVPKVAFAQGTDDYPMQTSRYIRISAADAGLVLFEIGFLDEDGQTLPVSIIDASSDGAEALIDEQDVVPEYPFYMNSSYFDEIYFARTAYEQLNGLKPYEYTHPPLGKNIMMIGIAIFGMCPFGWRCMGALTGVLMVPLMYLLVKQLTGSRKLSLIAMLLMALDSMHFTQSRLGTVDSYAVFFIMLMYLFMFRYARMSWNRQALKKTLVPLALSGIFFGCASSVKWIGIYAGAGLAVIFFMTVYRRFREYLAAGDSKSETWDACRCVFWKDLLITIGFCVIAFIVVPLLIYYFSYYWQMKSDGGLSIARVVDLQKTMFSYHSNLGGDTHYFRSDWYEWPVIWWPMWYYSGTKFMAQGIISSISCMGNPAVWWFGLIAILTVTVAAAWHRRAPMSWTLVIIGFASQYLPWVLVPRSTFIYHYFASVPFIIAASAILLGEVRRRSQRAFAVTAAILLAAALVLFVMFYPLESGMPVARSYAMLLRWFKWYNF